MPVEPRTAIRRLTDVANAVRAGAFPASQEEAAQPGLYSWWVDELGGKLLSKVVGAELPPLIYAGQAGATSTRSKTERAATLGSRIGGNHLGGNIGSSTFRKTLTALLREPLELVVAGPKCLDQASNARLSDWMRAHLSIAIAPLPDRSQLAEAEHALLLQLDPPLNLMGMPKTPVRARLRELRRTLTRLTGKS